MKVKLTFVLFLFLALNMNGQESSDSLLFSKADSLSKNTRKDLAIQLLKGAQPEFKKTKNWELYIQSLNYIARYQELENSSQNRVKNLNLAINTGEKHLDNDHLLLGFSYQQKGEVFIGLMKIDSALYYLDKAVLIFEKHQDWENVCWAQITKAVAYYYNSQFHEAERVFFNTFEFVQKKTTINIDVPKMIFQNLAAIYIQIGAYDKSLEFAEEAIKITLEYPLIDILDSIYLADRYNNLGVIYSEREDFSKAIQNYKIGLNLRRQTRINPSELIRYNHNIGMDLQLSGKLDEAHKYFQENLFVLENNSSECTFKDSIDVNLFLAVNSLEKGDYEESLKLLEKTTSLVIKNKYEEYDLFHMKGKSYQAQGEICKAIFYFEKANQFLTIEPDNYHKNYIKNLSRLSEAYLAQEDLKKSLNTVQKVSSNFQPNFTPISPFSNPNLEEISAYTLLLPILETKTKVLTKLYAADLKSLEKILPTYRLATQTIDHIRENQVSQESKLLLSTNARNIYNGAIDLLFQLYESSSDPNYLEEAFLYIERSKSLILLEGIREYKALQSNVQPLFEADSVFQRLVQEEKKLKLDKVFFERKLSEAKQKDDSLKINNIESTLAKTYEDQQNLQRQFAQEYPTYHQVNFNHQVVSIAQVQKQLLSTNSNKALLEYYLGKNAIFVIRITGEKADFFRLDYPSEFDESINTYRKSLTNNSLKTSEKEKHQEFIQSAHQLYQGLLAPILEDLPEEVQQLFLITDGKLGYISFESLLTSLPASDEINYSINHLDYLLEEWIISYGYSSTLLLENTQLSSEKKNLKPYAGFAPVYDQHDGVAERSCESGQPLGALINSEISVKNLHELLGGNLFLREEASKDNFLATASEYRILHLSTHACVDDQDPLFNRIFFANDYLPTYEVYNLHLNADLVVLSACETGFGELVKGEGIMSLARSFMYAGSKSVVTSLWNANDYSTTQIMIAFHQNLDKGLSKEEALHKAKLEYLNQSASRVSTPYYWANFILIGNTGPIEFDAFTWEYYLGILLILVLFGLIIFRMRKKKRPFSN